MGLALKPDVYFCLANDVPVFLDVTADRYVTLPTDLSDRFLAILCRAGSLLSCDMEAVDLLETGLFIETTERCEEIASPRHRLPTRSALEFDLPMAHLSRIAVAGISQLITTARLKTSTLSQNLKTLRERHEPGQLGEAMQAKAYECVHAFLMTRRLVPTQNRCLQRSIALIEFLSWHGIFANLMIGVRMQPFGAHAWVQIEDVVLNDYLDEVLVYTPIVAV
jgi:hypothetical protein